MSNITTTLTVDLLSKPSSLSEAQLIDQIAELRQTKATLEKREKLLVEALKSRHKNFEWITPETGEVILEGSRFLCKPVLVIQRRLDTESLREEFGEDWMEEHSKSISFIQMRFVPAEKEEA